MPVFHIVIAGDLKAPRDKLVLGDNFCIDKLGKNCKIPVILRITYEII
jgi:hypothetical protein